jgi:predicted nucleic acid-binding Zn ribbon protein
VLKHESETSSAASAPDKSVGAHHKCVVCGRLIQNADRSFVCVDKNICQAIADKVRRELAEKAEKELEIIAAQETEKEKAFAAVVRRHE